MISNGMSCLMLGVIISLAAGLVLTGTQADSQAAAGSVGSATGLSAAVINAGSIAKQMPDTVQLAAGSEAQMLHEQLSAVDVTPTQANVGIGVLDLDTGERWFLNGNQRFPMQSVVKLPLAIAVLKQVDEGKLALDQPVTVTRSEFAPAWSPMLKEISGDRAQFTVEDLLRRSLQVSDNTAADVLARLVGGPGHVTAMLRAMNLPDIRYDRLERQLQPDCVGLTNFRPELADVQKYDEAVRQIPDAVKQAALTTYLHDPRDTATPAGMVELLAALQSHRLLSTASTDLLLTIITGSTTGQKRLKAGLPEGWSIAHKTGSGPDVLGVNTATNDAGIIRSPQGKQVAIVVFMAGSKAPLEVREKLMADVTSAVVKAIQ